MPNYIPLSRSQRELMNDFYDKPFTKTVIDKKGRNELWHGFRKNKSIPDIDLQRICPALLHEMSRSIESGGLVQSAVFSECVYAQTLANMYGLDTFAIFASNPECLSLEIIRLISSYDLKPRYIYRSSDGNRILIQAGGPNGVDGALIEVFDLNISTIEFKESAAKTSEPDLPKYGEDGYLRVTSDFLFKYPQFEHMLTEQLDKRLNIMDSAGSNIKDFSEESIKHAVSENYTAKKFADVICTEDKSSYLTMLPANQLTLWAQISGEIRPAGRNPYAVWTPLALSKLIQLIEGTVSGSTVSILEDRLSTASARGGDGTIKRYKLHPLFFVYARDVKFSNGEVHFMLEDIHQLNPTVSAHMFFRKLDVKTVKSHYEAELTNG